MRLDHFFQKANAAATKPALRWAAIGAATAALAGVLLTATWWSGDVADHAADDLHKTEPRPPVVQLPHAGGVETFKLFADGRYLLTRSVPGEVMLWDARSGQRLGWLDAPGDTLGTWRSYALAPDERRLITWAPRAELVLWDAENIKQIRTLREADGQSSHPLFAISPDSRSVLLAGTSPERGLEHQSLDSGDLLWTSAVKSDKPLQWVQFSDDGLYAVGKDGGGGLHVWNARTGQYVWNPGTPKPYAEELLEERRAEIAASKPRLERLTVDISGYLLLLSHVRPDGKILSYPFADPASSSPTDFFSPDGKRYVSRNWWDTGSDCDETVLWDIASAKPLRVFFEDGGRSDVFAFSGDGRRFVRGILSKEAQLIDAGTGETLRTFAGHATEITSLALAPDEKTILTGDKSGTAILWHAATGTRLQQFTGHGENVRCAAYAPDSSAILVAGNDGRTTAYSSQTGNALLVLNSSLQRTERAIAAYSPDGTRIVTRSALWEAASGKQVARLAALPTHSILLSPNGRWALGARTKVIGAGSSVQPVTVAEPLRLWNTDSGATVHTFQEYYQGDPMRGDDVVQRSSTESSAGRGEFRFGHMFPNSSLADVWLTASGRETVASIPGLDDDTRTWLVNLGAKAVAVPSAENYRNRTLLRSPRTRREIRVINRNPVEGQWNQNVAIVFDGLSNKALATLDARPLAPWAAAFNRDDTQVLILYHDQRETTLIVWDIATAQKVRQFVIPGENHVWKDSHVWSNKAVVLSPDERFAALSIGRPDADDLQYLLDLQGDASFFVTGRRTSAPMRPIALFSPDSRRVVCYGDRAMLCDIGTQRALADLGNSYNGVDGVLFSPNGKWLTSSGNDGTVMWDAESGKVRHKLGPRWNTLLRFDPSGTRMLTLVPSVTGNGLWDFEAGELISDLATESDKRPNDAFFTPDGDRVITTHHHALAVWDAATGQRLHAYQDASYESPLSGNLQSPFFLSDGRLVTLQHAEATVWDPEMATPLQRLPFPHSQRPSAQLRPGAAELLTVSPGNVAILWDIDSGAKRQTFHGVPAAVTGLFGYVGFSGDGQRIVARHRGGELAVVWDVDTGEIVRRYYLLDEGQAWLTELPATGQFSGATEFVK